MLTAPEEVEIFFVIADLSGYTALTETHGDFHAADAVDRFGEIGNAALVSGTRVLERVGDELLIAADTGNAAVETALRLRRRVEAEPLFPTVRAGIHGGRVVRRGDRYFGAALNLTARVASHARGGQILCTEAVAHAAGQGAGVASRPLGEVRFKNVSTPVRIFEIVAPGETAEALSIDPVCRMQVRPDLAPARLEFESHAYYFCSFECARVFASSPATFVKRE